MKKYLPLAAVLASTVAAHAIIYSTNWTAGFVNSGVVPDNNFSGWADTRTVSTMPAGTLQSVAVNLNLSSGWMGDLYAYLVHSSGFAVLLNQVGTPGQPFGYSAGTMTATLADDGFNGGTYASIHSFGGGNATGFYNPDGGAMSSFLSSPANGTWSLFIADLSGGGVTTVSGWGLQMDIVAVPETETWVAAALAGMFGAFWLNRQIMSGVKKDACSRGG